MKRILPVMVALLAVTAACGDEDDKAADTPTAAPSTSAPTTPAPATPAPATTTTAPPASSPLVVAPGRVGAAQVGMTKAQAVATGLFDANVSTGDDGCQAVIPLRWKKVYGSSIDVLLDGSKKIASMGITKGGPKTAKGIGVGSTFAQVRDAYADLTPIEEAGYDQSGDYVVTGDKLYLGFLYNETAQAATDSSKVTFMEVTKGEKPSLMRDGC